MRHPRAIDEPLVDAYLARRALDYLVGFTLSPGAVAQIAGRPFRGPGAVGSASARLRPRARDRAIQDPGILDHPGRARHRQGRDLLGAASSPIDGKKLDKFDIADERGRRALKAALEGGTLHRRRASRARRSGATRRRPSPPRPCSRRPPASSASRRARPCRSPSASMRASTSAARPWASLPICEPTACRSCRRPSPRCGA